MPFEKLPIRKEIIASFWPTGHGVERAKEKKLFVKRSSESWNREFSTNNYSGTKKQKFKQAAIDALAHARFFQDLASVGFYHPKTQFLVAQSEAGHPEVVAVMPEMEQMKRSDVPEADKVKQSKIAKVKTRFKLKDSDISPDALWPWNWGKSNSDFHYFDFEFFREQMPIHLLEAYRKKITRTINRRRQT